MSALRRRTPAVETVDDVHSRLNATRVAGVERPRDVDALRAAVLRHDALAICGGRHAMGGQQFAQGQVLLDLRGLNAVHRFDPQRGLLEMEAGATWPEVIDATRRLQPGNWHWGIRQKQTGADDLTLGGAVAANIHGRGLRMRPFVEDVESLSVVVADGSIVRCGRDENRELFALVVGGYGLFGVVATVTLRLAKRQKMRRRVDVLDIDEALAAAHRRVSEGCVYGDFQYAIDPSDDGFLRRGVCACYAPAEDDAPVDESAGLRPADWADLIRLAYRDKRAAFAAYSQHYLSTHGQVYWSDLLQLSTYLPGYEQFLPGGDAESLVIGELYVPPTDLPEFLAKSRRVLREMRAEDIYGTIRSIVADGETFLAWAPRDWACVIFNLRTPHHPHTAAGVARTAEAFRRLYDAALSLRGSFYLTYGRHARRDHIEAAYPQFEAFLARKRERDPGERFTSNWHRHMSGLFA